MFKNPIPQDNAKSAQPWIAIVMAILVPTVVVVNYNAGFKQIWPFTAVVSIAFIIATYDNFRRNREMFFGLSVVLLMIHAGTLYILNHGASAFLVPIFLVPLSAPLIIRSVKTLFWSELVLTLLFLFFGIYGYRNFELPFSAILISPIAFLSINFTQRNSLKKKVKLKEQTTIIEKQLTELKKQQKILEEKSNTIETKSLALKKTNEHLEQFTYIVSHDLKSPIRGVKNYAAFTLEDCAETLDDEAVANLKKIESLADKMNTLIEDLLAFSKLKKVEPNKTVVHLNEPLMSVQSDLENYPEIQIEIQSNKLPSVKVDRVRIKEVFLNFVTNAHKYNESANKVIKFVYSEQDGCLSITDNGIGIKEEDFSKVFAFFKRIHGQNDYGGGTGAGMAIVKSICDNHNIPVSIQSELGKGTTFKLDLKNVLAK